MVYQAKQGSNQWFIQQQQTWQQIHPQVIIRSNHADSLRSAALNGQGLVLFPDWLIGEDLKAGRLTELFAQQPCSISKQPLYIAAIYPQTQAMPLKVRTVLDFFLTQFGQLEGACYWKYPTA
ncbi:LysR substrate binding domain-containing protein [Acinetobacter calcoaceticus]|uniref:LysR substrate binding domain-containing protein n=1 Tax=Acinetobacter calcoaceticus TaxID=471 RepID=A0A4R1XCL4_ACICA|nr:LysR substrate binding domain-containing protein [Acinetobacter calcoaceticus]